MAIYYGNRLIGQVGFGTLGASSIPVELSTPTFSINQSTGVITATVTQTSSGYVIAGSKSATLDIVVSHPDPVVAINSSTGAISARHTQNVGYVLGGTSNDTKQLIVQGAKTITPSSVSQVAVQEYRWTTGNITVDPIPSNYIIPSGNRNITSSDNNSTVDVTQYATVSVSIPTGSTIKNQNKTVNPSSTTQTITHDIDANNYTGLGTITVNSIPETYVGGSIPRQNSLDVSGATVTANAGYYSAAATVTIASAAHADPTVAINSSTGLVTATHNQAAAGYVTAGQTSKTLQLTTVAAKSITPNSTVQTAVAQYRWTTGAVTVNSVPTETETFTGNGTYTPTSGKYFSSVTVSVPTGSTVKNQNKTVNPTSTQQTITFDVDANNYTGLGTVTINSIPSTYIGSGITQNPTITVSGKTVTIPAGYYSSQNQKSVQDGSAGTPTASKGSVNNHQISITPSVINSTGWITGGTKTGTAVVVAASELVSGTLSVDSNGIKDVTNYASINVNIPSSGGNLHSISKTYTPTESIITETISPNSGFDGLSSVDVIVNAISSTYVGSAIPRRTSADIVFNTNGNLFDPNSDVLNAYIAAATGRLTSSGNDRAVIIPLAANTEYTFTWNRTALNGDTTDDVNIGVFTSYPAVNSVGRYIGTTKETGGTITFTTSNSENYAAIKIAQVTKTDFDQTLIDSTLYATNGNIISVPSGYYQNGSFTTIPTETKTITANGTYIPSTNKLFSSVIVDVPTGSTIHNQDKTVSPSTIQQTISADSGYTGLNTVTVNAISPIRVASDVTASGATVTVKSGYYSAQVQKSVESGSATTPTTSIAASFGTGSVNSTGLVTIPIANTSKSITPTVSSGYVSAGTAGTITVTGSGTFQLSTMAGSTITPKSSQQTVSTSGKYLTGNIVINGDNNLIAGNIKSGVSIFGIEGSYSGASYSTQAKTEINPTTSSQTIYPDTGFDALSSVQINAISPLRTSTDITASGATVTISSGYYSTNQTKTIGSGNARPAASITGTGASFTTGTNTVTFTKTINNTPQVTAGYISSGTAGDTSVTLTATIATRAATTYRASTSAVTIASGICTGVSTIAAVSQTNLTAANIKAGTTISVSNGQSNLWSVAGTFTSDATAIAADINSGVTAYVNGSKVTGTQIFSTIHTGTSAPASSLGVNGDVYLVLV